MDTQKPTEYKLYTYQNSILVLLSENHSIPYLNDCVASQSSGVGVDLTDPKNYDEWIDACLCWNVLGQRHEFHNKANLRLLEGKTDGFIPFDHATGQLRSVLSLLKFTQDKLYQNQIFETTLNLVDKSTK